MRVPVPLQVKQLSQLPEGQEYAEIPDNSLYSDKLQVSSYEV